MQFMQLLGQGQASVPLFVQITNYNEDFSSKYNVLLSKIKDGMYNVSVIKVILYYN